MENVFVKYRDDSSAAEMIFPFPNGYGIVLISVKDLKAFNFEVNTLKPGFSQKNLTDDYEIVSNWNEKTLEGCEKLELKPIRTFKFCKRCSQRTNSFKIMNHEIKGTIVEICDCDKQSKHFKLIKILDFFIS